MEAKSTNAKTFQFTANSKPVGELIYKNLLFLKAQIKLKNSQIYEVKPLGIFGTSISVTKNGAEVANLKMNWRGQIVFTFQNGDEFVFKAKSMFSNQYIIENKDGEKLIQFDAKFNWRKFNYNYKISNNKKPQDPLFAFLGVYAANYLIASMSGSGG